MKQGFDRHSKDIAPWRKALYYAGLALMALGGISFLSVFVNIIRTMGSPFGGFDTGPGFMVWGVVGMALLIVGSILRGIGARGLAGSGLVLDPQQAREDLHPYTDALGGLARDAVDGFKAADGTHGQPAIKVRCRNCKALNDESDAFCGRCGQPLD